jgi:hypothetical protein
MFMRVSGKSIFCLILFSSLSFAQSFSVGVKGGIPLSDPFSDKTISTINSVVHSFSGSTNFVVGPMVELHLPLGFSVEADALYRPMSLVTESVPNAVSRALSDHNSWKFPILVKYRFLHTPIIKPFIEAGPSFRTVDSTLSNQLSKKGFTLGGGIELKLAMIRLGPELRYTRWGSDAGGTVQSLFSSNPNQAEFLVGISF